MTGQVKEDILSRFGELGVFIRDGSLVFDPCLLRKDEFLSNSTEFNYIDVDSKEQSIRLDEGTLCFTYCQVPVVYRLASQNKLSIVYNDNTSAEIESLKLDQKTSNEIFDRTGKIRQIIAYTNEAYLR